MDHAPEQALDTRDRFRRKLEAKVPIEQRVHDLFQRMAQKVPGQGMSAQGYEHFLRRNFKKRAIHSHANG